MPVLVDSNVILDIFTKDPKWFEWSSETLAALAERELLYINPIIYSEISISFERIEELEQALPNEYIYRENLPYEAAFLGANKQKALKFHGILTNLLFIKAYR